MLDPGTDSGQFKLSVLVRALAGELHRSGERPYMKSVLSCLLFCLFNEFHFQIKFKCFLLFATLSRTTLGEFKPHVEEPNPPFGAKTSGPLQYT